MKDKFPKEIKEKIKLTFDLVPTVYELWKWRHMDIWRKKKEKGPEKIKEMRAKVLN